jgi:hypothetical protein
VAIEGAMQHETTHGCQNGCPGVKITVQTSIKSKHRHLVHFIQQTVKTCLHRCKPSVCIDANPPFTRTGLCVHAEILPWRRFTLVIFTCRWYSASKPRTLQGPVSRSESASTSVRITTLEQLQIEM